MIRVDIETIVMAAGSIPSIIVLRERSSSSNSESPMRALSIQTGSYEAASISRGIKDEDNARPISHDVLANALTELGAKVARVEIDRVEAPVFYASIIINDKEGVEHKIDARPSDAIALAVRTNAPIFVEDDVMNRAGSVSYRSDEDAEAEYERFDEFVQTLSPDDF